MSTTMVEDLAVELESIGPIYPFVGSEGLLVVLAFAAWLGWHAWQMREERRVEEDILRELAERDKGKA